MDQDSFAPHNGEGSPKTFANLPGACPERMFSGPQVGLYVLGLEQLKSGDGLT